MGNKTFDINNAWGKSFHRVTVLQSNVTTPQNREKSDKINLSFTRDNKSGHVLCRLAFAR